LPTIWFRNQWSWQENTTRPILERVGNAIKAADAALGDYYLYLDKEPQLLFTENDTNTNKIFGVPNRNPYVKDGINDYLVNGRKDAVNPEQKGTKAAADYQVVLKPGESQVIRLRLSDIAPRKASNTNDFAAGFEEIFNARKKETDDFYNSILLAPKDNISSSQTEHYDLMRQALLGMMWNKQFYLYDVNKWLKERGFDPYKTNRKAAQRNEQWHHMNNSDIISIAG